MPKVIVVEGLIAAGKTSLLKMLKENFEGSVPIYEPVDEWERSGALEEFYSSLQTENPSPYVYMFQTYAFMTRIKRIIEKVKENPDAEIYFLERSVFSDRHLFIEMLKDTGQLTEKNHQLYLDWWDMWTLVMPVKIDGFIYLNPSADECMRRLKIRSREGETVDLDYQLELKKKHDEFLKEPIVIENRTVPCLEISTDEDFRNEPGPVLKQIKDFVASI